MIKQHNITISKGFEHNAPCNKMYQGGRLVYQRLFIPEPPQPFSGKWLATYSDLHTESAECDASSSITGSSSSTEIPRTNLVSVEIGNCVTSIGVGAFYNCTSLTSINIPDSVTSISANAFYNCASLTSITIPDSVTSIGSNAFDECTNLTSIEIPDSVTIIDDWAFYKCSGATTLTIGNGVTSIGAYAFGYCTSLTSLVLPQSITSIGQVILFRCNSMESVTCLATTPPEISFGAFDNMANCPIYVPFESVDAYKAATNWSDYADRIQPIT